MNTATKTTLSVLILALFVFGLVLVVMNGRPPVRISAAVVPHHDIVASQRAQFFRQLAEQIDKSNYPETIILVSPNHYLAGQSKLQTSDHEWQLNKGSVNANTEVISKLLSTGAVSNEPSSFYTEHGIYNILRDIHRTFPQAKLVPIILKDASQAQLDKLEKSLLESCRNCLMIASVDFSHYQPALIADLHDQKTIRDLQTLNTADVLKNAEVDSGASLALLTMWSRDHDTAKFNLQNHTNSDLLLDNPDLEGTSHVFGWYESGRQVKPKEFVSFVISNNLHIGTEDRSIWGTDLVLQDSDNILVAGKLTPNNLEFFALPMENNKLLVGSQKQQALNKFYEPYQKYLVSSSSGDYLNIPFSTTFSFENLSSYQIESKIKSVINLKQ